MPAIEECSCSVGEFDLHDVVPIRRNAGKKHCKVNDGSSPSSVGSALWDGFSVEKSTLVEYKDLHRFQCLGLVHYPCHPHCQVYVLYRGPWSYDERCHRVEIKSWITVAPHA